MGLRLLRVIQNSIQFLEPSALMCSARIPLCVTGIGISQGGSGIATASDSIALQQEFVRIPARLPSSVSRTAIESIMVRWGLQGIYDA